MKSQQINDKVDMVAEMTKYILVKWETITKETGLYLTAGSNKKTGWSVNESFGNLKSLKKGSFKQCVDFILNKWKAGKK